MRDDPLRAPAAPLTVSVILVVRNGAEYIAEALASVTHSQARPLEILVIDGGSTDGTLDIARRFPLVRIIEQRSTGIAAAYNEGIAAARGELVAFISHDDRWLPGKLDRQLAAMEGDPRLMFTVTHVRHVLDAGATPPHGFRAELLDAPVAGMIMEALVARRSVFDVVGPFDSSFAVSEDTDWFARARDAGVPMAVLPETLVEKRIHGSNTSLNTPAINLLLLRALRGSIERKRQAAEQS
jgi:glycosyltransferase involved in cell wall biosynthesis